MRVIVTVAVAQTPGREATSTENVLIDAPPDTPMTDILYAVRAGLGRGPALPPGGLPHPTGQPRGMTFRHSGLMDGAVLTLGGEPAPLGADAAAVVGLAEIRFVGGSGSGRVRRLRVGETLLGTDSSGSAVIAPAATDDTVPVAAVTVVASGSTRVRALDGYPNLFLERTPVGSTALDWLPGMQLHIGGSVLSAHPITRSDAQLIPSADSGWLDYNRPPRLRPPVSPLRFRLPAPPPAPSRNPLPWITAMLPALLGVSMAVLLKQPFYLLFALMSPVMMISSNLSSRRNGKKSHRRMLIEHGEILVSIGADVTATLAAEQHRRRVDTPDAAELMLAATAPTRRLWERRSTDADHLQLRVGSADLASAIDVEDLAQLEHRRQQPRSNTAVPVTLSLAEAGVIGVAGDGDFSRRMGQWIVGQFAVLQSPRDLQVYVLGAPETITAWNWAHWLPHLRPALGQDAVSLLGSDADSLGRRVAELGQLITERTAATTAANARAIRHTPDILVVLDGARRLRAMPGIVTLLRDGPAVGIHVLCLDLEERQLPEECTAVIAETSPGRLCVTQDNAAPVTGVLADVVSDGWFEEVARSLSPIRDVTPSESDSLVPDSANLLDVLELSTPTGTAILAKWAADGRSTEAVVGVSIDGPFSVDLVRDGPHGLVAGTTGSGKSEFLQTLVASLAVANRPDAMTFVLIDYKGGAAFSQCVDLPHTVGMVTDLDPHLVQRALNSLRAELVRREQALALVGAKDLEDYYAHVGGSAAPLPRLAIVIDEFAAMAKELPDFVAGLIGIAQRGRSLGVHLVMATQRPSGVISPEIRANTNLRIALRMTDAGESSDVIDIADASRIPKSIPGRAYARLGHASIIPFQTARVGGTHTSLVSDVPDRAPFVARLGWQDFALPVPQAPLGATASSDVTDLSLLVASIREASATLGIPAQHSPWLPPLPTSIPLADLLAFDAAAGAGAAAASSTPKISWAREDIPAHQEQANAVLDLAKFGHLYIVGAPGSGRSQALRTIAASAASTTTTSDIHLYGIDCGNGALSSLASLPHCGAVTQRNQPERASRLLQRLEAEVLRRHEILGAANHANITEQRRLSAPADRLPHILVLIDRWENFITTLGEAENGRLLEIVYALLRDGASAGIHVIIAGDRSLLTSRMSVLTEDKIILRLTDRLDYTLGNLNHKTIPLEIPAGRGYRADSGLEVQIALLGDDASGIAQNEAVYRLGQELSAAETAMPSPVLPFRVDELPANLSLEQAQQLTGGQDHGPMWAMVGVGGDQLVAQGIDLERDAPTFVVAGPARSGRSTLLVAMARSLLASGTELVLACPRTSPLRELAGLPGVRVMFTHTELEESDLAPHLDPDGTPVVLVIDDGELVMDCPAKIWLRSYIRTATDNRRGMILGGNSAEVCAGFAGWQVDLKKNRRGALLSPQNTIDGDLVGMRVTRSMVSNKVTPGRALAHLGTGDFVTLQIPTASLPLTSASPIPAASPLPTSSPVTTAG
ncbi:MAG: cell division protein FtsK [Glaciihabitans sp.]|nr:cell division protein FtsK [Glaciihabitans sp.]